MEQPTLFVCGRIIELLPFLTFILFIAVGVRYAMQWGHRSKRCMHLGGWVECCLSTELSSTSLFLPLKVAVALVGCESVLSVCVCVCGGGYLHLYMEVTVFSGFFVCDCVLCPCVAEGLASHSVELRALVLRVLPFLSQICVLLQEKIQPHHSGASNLHPIPLSRELLPIELLSFPAGIGYFLPPPSPLAG